MPRYNGDPLDGHEFDSAMTMYEAGQLLRTLGMTLTAKPTGEFRVAFKDGPWKGESHSYYSSSLQDAINTAQDMARRLREFEQSIVAARPDLADTRGI